MGLTIHYELSVSENLGAARGPRIGATRRALRAKDRLRGSGGGAAGGGDELDAPLFVHVGRPEDCCFGSVAPRRGWLVEVWPGEGCESAAFGLCQYPRRIPFRAGSVPTGFEGGWLLKSRCKTQYAGEHGWQHFLTCHKQIISLLDFWRGLGVQVKVSDEGSYWETRSEKALMERLGLYDGLVAAVAGMLKDASGASDGPLRLEAPIFDYAHFERLEHEGWQSFGRPLEELQKMCRKGRF